jgi:hypothetical protein
MSSSNDASGYSSGGSQPGSAAAAFHTAGGCHADSGGQSVSLAPPGWAVRRFGPPRPAAGFADADDDEMQHGSAQIDTVESLRESSVVIRPGGGAPLEDDAATGPSGFGFAAMAAPGIYPTTASREQQYAAAEAAAAAYREKRNPEAGAPPLPLGSGASLATSSSWVSTDISGLSQRQQYAAGAGAAAGVAGGQPFCPPMAASMHRFGAPPQQQQVQSTHCKPRRPLPNVCSAASVQC